MKSIRFPLSVLLVLLTHTASAFTPVNGGGSEGRLTGGVLMQDTRYDANDNFDVEATMLMVAYKASLGPKFSLGGGLGLVLDGELGDTNMATDGSGFRLFVDGQYQFKQFDRNELIGTFGLTHDRFSYNLPAGLRDIDLDFKMTEIKFGALMLHRIQSLSIYGGLEAFLYSSGEIEVDNGSSSTDADRDDRLNARLGAAFAVDTNLDLRADLYLISEQSVFLGADFRF